MAKTSTFDIDGDGTPDGVTAEIPCRFVYVRENGAAGTTDYDVHVPTASDTPMRRVAGEQHPFDAGVGNLFQKDQVVGFLNAATPGTYTFSKLCE